MPPGERMVNMNRNEVIQTTVFYVNLFPLQTMQKAHTSQSFQVLNVEDNFSKKK